MLWYRVRQLFSKKSVQALAILGLFCAVIAGFVFYRAPSESRALRTDEAASARPAAEPAFNSPGKSENPGPLDEMRNRLEYEKKLTEEAFKRVEAAEQTTISLTRELQACKSTPSPSCAPALTPDKASKQQFDEARAAIESTVSQMDRLIDFLNRQ